MPLRGKTSDSSVFYDLNNFRIESGDTVLKDHFKTCAANAKYTSVQTQNELIGICQSVLQKKIVSDANRAGAFSILADETADISGTEQLSIGVRFVDTTSVAVIREEFLGFVPVKYDLAAENIANVILQRCRELGLDLNLMIEH